MKPKITLLTLLIALSLTASSQVITSVDSILAKYDTLSAVPDNLLDKVDTSNKTLVGQVKSSDTIRSGNTSKAQVEEKKPEVNKKDRRWFVSPLLKFQAQEFGMLEHQRWGGNSNAYLLPFVNKTNRSVAASVYKNFTKNISMSLDLGMSKGRVTTKDQLISNAPTSTFYLGNTTLYYHLLGGQYKLQPFISAGFNALYNKQPYLSLPAGAGVKFTSKKIMIEAQGAYGYAMSANIANTLMYHLGVYIPFKTKKQKQEEAKKDSAGVNVTNIINNYYLLNNADSLKKAAEDSIRILEEERERLLMEDKAESEDPYEELDPDDPMRLPAARKFTVYFYYDQYALTSSAFNSIDRVIQLMKENKNLYVHLKGHTDMAGSESYNSPLSKKRAQMVFDYMNSRGIGIERMVMSSYGKKNPAVRNEDPNTAWMNRRCELVLFEKR